MTKRELVVSLVVLMLIGLFTAVVFLVGRSYGRTDQIKQGSLTIYVPRQIEVKYLDEARP